MCSTWTSFLYKSANGGQLPLSRLIQQTLVAQSESDARPTGDDPAMSSNILSWSLIMKYILQSFFPFHRFSFWQKNVHMY